MEAVQQLVIRVPDQMAAAVDALVEAGEYDTRSDAVRAAVEALLDRRRRDEIGRQIAAGYERLPTTDAEMAEADAAAVAMIEAEPW